MGNWSPYSEEWEKQRLEKAMDQLNAERRAFEKKPKPYKAMVRLCKTIKYYGSLAVIHIRMVFDRKYREEVRHSVDEMDDKMIRFLADIAKADKKD